MKIWGKHTYLSSIYCVPGTGAATVKKTMSLSERCDPERSGSVRVTGGERLFSREGEEGLPEGARGQPQENLRRHRPGANVLK